MGLWAGEWAESAAVEGVAWTRGRRLGVANRVVGVVRRVVGVAHRVVGVAHRVTGVAHRVVGVAHHVVGVVRRGVGVATRWAGRGLPKGREAAWPFTVDAGDSSFASSCQKAGTCRSASDGG